MQTKLYRTMDARQFSTDFTEGTLYIGVTEVDGTYIPYIVAGDDAKTTNYTPAFIIQCSMPTVIEGVESEPQAIGLLEKFLEEQARSTQKSRNARERTLFREMQHEVDDMFYEGFDEI